MAADVQFLSFRKMMGYGTTEIRCIQPVRFLRSAGFSADAAALEEAAGTPAKVVVLHRLRWDSLTSRVIKFAKRQGAALVYDTDDLLTNPTTPDRFAPDVEDVLRHVDVVSVSGRYLKDLVNAIHPDCRVMSNKLSQNVMDLGARSLSRRRPPDGVVTLGYFSGSAHHDADFQLITPQLIALMKAYPNVQLMVAGRIQVDPAFDVFHDRFRFEKFRPYADFIGLLGQIDINLAPLDLSSSIACARSELKYIEAAAFGVPTVASPTAAYCDAIHEGETGFLCDGDTWFDTLAMLVQDADRRDAVGARARGHVEAAFSPEAGSSEWAALVTELTQKNRFSEAGIATWAEGLGASATGRWRMAKRGLRDLKKRSRTLDQSQ